MRKGLVWRLSIVIISVFLVLFVVNAALTLMAVRDDSKESAELLTQSNAREMAKEIELTLESTLSYLETERTNILTLYEKGELTGDAILDMRYENLLKNDFLIGSSILLNPGVVNVNTPRAEAFQDKNGYFVPYVYYSGAELVIEPVLEYKGEDWYEQPIQEKRKILTDPYEYDTGNAVLQMVTLSLPIITKDGTVLGGMYTDFPLDFVNEVLELYSQEGSSQRTMTASGYIMGSFNTKGELGQNLHEIAPETASYATQIQKGEVVSIYSEESDREGKVLTTFVPIQVGDIQEKWYVESIVPEKQILSTFTGILIQTIISAIIISLILAAIVIYILRKNLASLHDVQQALLKAASGELTAMVNTDRLANDEIGIVAHAYNDMRKQMHEIVEDVTNVSNEVSDSAKSIAVVMDEVTRASDHVSRAIDEISDGAQHQAENIDHANRKITQLGELIDDVSTVSNEMTNHIHTSTQHAHKGMEEVRQLRENTERTNEVNEELTSQMSELVHQIGNINNIMQTIQSITAQTNLLALNASIEAARAGEYGKGFAVVADEVRKLAEQSHQETENVQSTVQHILRASEQTQAVVEKSASIMDAQNESVEHTRVAFEQQLHYGDTLATEVDLLIGKLRVMVDEKEHVLHDMRSIASISEQSTASAEEVSAAAEQQKAEVETVLHMAHQLQAAADLLRKETLKFQL